MKKELIKEVQNYFTEKLIKGEYEIEKLKRHTVHLIIDGYNFTFWIANGLLSFRQYSELDESNFIDLDLRPIDAKDILEVLTPKMEEVKNGELREEKLREFNRLKKELEIE